MNRNITPDQSTSSMKGVEERPESSAMNDQVIELIAIGAAVAANCEPCFKFHYDAARKLGATPEHMRAAVDIALRVKAAPAKAMLELTHRFLATEGEPNV